jgi:hypothetical protein
VTERELSDEQPNYRTEWRFQFVMSQAGALAPAHDEYATPMVVVDRGNGVNFRLKLRRLQRDYETWKNLESSLRKHEKDL